MKKRILFIFGTRPEAIKMAPVIQACLAAPGIFEVRVCVTGQHKEMLLQVMNFFDLPTDYDLELMQPNQTLFDITSKGLVAIGNVLEKCKPDLVLVQGDTTTSLVGALAAYYHKIKVAHIEAGLRSYDKYSPFPEEINRRLVGSLADFHFAPTQKAVDNLDSENIQENVYLVGNTVIDALLNGLKKIEGMNPPNPGLTFLDNDKRMILITGHRRESFGEPFREICGAISDLALKYKDVQFVYPVHLNPNVREPVFDILGKKENIHLIEPVDYPSMIWLMQRSHLVLTDSGGVQEEAPSLGKPVLVMRDVTERTEGIDAGTALLVGTKKENIVDNTIILLEDQNRYREMSQAKNPYGDGTSSQQITEILKSVL